MLVKLLVVCAWIPWFCLRDASTPQISLYVRSKEWLAMLV